MKTNDKPKKRIIGKPAIKKIDSEKENSKESKEINSESKKELSEIDKTINEPETTGQNEKPELYKINANDIETTETKQPEISETTTKQIETISYKPKEKPKYTKRIKPEDSIKSIKFNKQIDKTVNTDIQEPTETREKHLIKLESKSTLFTVNLVLPSVLGLFDKDLKENKEKLLLSNNEMQQLEQPLQSCIDYYDIKINPLVVLAVMFAGIYSNKILEIKTACLNEKQIIEKSIGIINKMQKSE